MSMCKINMKIPAAHSKICHPVWRISTKNLEVEQKYDMLDYKVVCPFSFHVFRTSALFPILSRMNLWSEKTVTK